MTREQAIKFARALRKDSEWRDRQTQLIVGCIAVALLSVFDLDRDGNPLPSKDLAEDTRALEPQNNAEDYAEALTRAHRAWLLATGKDQP